MSSKISHLAVVPQGRPEAGDRVIRMLAQADREGFGGCSNTYACEAERPKRISVSHIARANREVIKVKLL